MAETTVQVLPSSVAGVRRALLRTDDGALVEVVDGAGARAAGVPQGGVFAAWTAEGDRVVLGAPLTRTLASLRPSALVLLALTQRVLEDLDTLHTGGGTHGALHPDGWGVDGTGAFRVRPVLHHPPVSGQGWLGDVGAVGATLRGVLDLAEAEAAGATRVSLWARGVAMTGERVSFGEARAARQALGAVLHGTRAEAMLEAWLDAEQVRLPARARAFDVARPAIPTPSADVERDARAWVEREIARTRTERYVRLKQDVEARLAASRSQAEAERLARVQAFEAARAEQEEADRALRAAKAERDAAARARTEALLDAAVTAFAAVPAVEASVSEDVSAGSPAPELPAAEDMSAPAWTAWPEPESPASADDSADASHAAPASELPASEDVSAPVSMEQEAPAVPDVLHPVSPAPEASVSEDVSAGLPAPDLPAADDVSAQEAPPSEDVSVLVSVAPPQPESPASDEGLVDVAADLRAPEPPAAEDVSAPASVVSPPAVDPHVAVVRIALRAPEPTIASPSVDVGRDASLPAAASLRVDRLPVLAVAPPPVVTTVGDTGSVGGREPVVEPPVVAPPVVRPDAGRPSWEGLPAVTGDPSRSAEKGAGKWTDAPPSTPRPPMDLDAPVRLDADAPGAPSWAGLGGVTGSSARMYEKGAGKWGDAEATARPEIRALVRDMGASPVQDLPERRLLDEPPGRGIPAGAFIALGALVLCGLGWYLLAG